MTIEQCYEKINQLLDEKRDLARDLYGKIGDYQDQLIEVLKERNAYFLEREMARQVAQGILDVAQAKTGERIINDALLAACPWLKEK